MRARKSHSFTTPSPQNLIPLNCGLAFRSREYTWGYARFREAGKSLYCKPIQRVNCCILVAPLGSRLCVVVGFADGGFVGFSLKAPRNNQWRLSP